MRKEEYRRLLGTLLLWALLPFPFLYIILPPFWFVAAGVGMFLVARPSKKVELSPLVLNLIAVAIIIIVVIVGGLRVGPLRPLGHLLLLLTSVRALVIRDRKTFLSALLPVFLVWVVAVTSSTHLTIVPYFALSAGLWWWAGMRIHLASLGVGHRQAGASLPRLRHAAAAGVAALMLAGPLFVVMPRLRAPWVAGRGGVSSVTGFSSHVDLGGVGTIRQSPEVAMIVRSVSDRTLDPRWMKLRATALERVTIDSWAPRGTLHGSEHEGQLVWPWGRGWSLQNAAELEIEIVYPRRYLFLPEGTIAVRSPVPVRLDPSGGVVLAARPRGPLIYSVWVHLDEAPRPSDARPDSLPAFELNPEVRQLVSEMISGHRTDSDRAAAVESYLQLNYAYSLSGMTHMRSDPVAWFLLTAREGHCEYFAGAMVAILNELGIPARLVAGYSGGDLSDDGKTAVVRESNAHAWVEAQVGDSSEWTSFDPTPAAEIPSLIRLTGRERLRWAVDWLQSSWDRYVLTYGFSEQVRIFSAMISGLETVVRSVSWWMLVTGLTVISAVGGLVRWLRRRRPSHRRPGTPAAAAMARLASSLGRAGIEVPPGATLRWIADRARSTWPTAGAYVGDLAWLAERELYAEAAPQPADRAVVRKLWVQVRRAAKKSA